MYTVEKAELTQSGPSKKSTFTAEGTEAVGHLHDLFTASRTAEGGESILTFHTKEGGTFRMMYQRGSLLVEAEKRADME